MFEEKTLFTHLWESVQGGKTNQWNGTADGRKRRREFILMKVFDSIYISTFLPTSTIGNVVAILLCCIVDCENMN